MSDIEPTPKYVTKKQLIAVCSVTGVLSVLAAYTASRVDLYRIERSLDRIEAKLDHGGVNQIQSVNTADAEFTKMTRDVLKKDGEIE